MSVSQRLGSRGFHTRRLFAVAGIEQPWPEPLPRDMALGFSIPLDFSVVTPASLEEAYWLRDDGVDRLLGTTPLFHDG